jgi:hypothetical protein
MEYGHQDAPSSSRHWALMTGLFSTWFVQAKRWQWSRSHKKVLQICVHNFSYFDSPKDDKEKSMQKKAFASMQLFTATPWFPQHPSSLYPFVLALLWKRMQGWAKQLAEREGGEEDPRERGSRWREQRPLSDRSAGDVTKEFIASKREGSGVISNFFSIWANNNNALQTSCTGGTTTTTVLSQDASHKHTSSQIRQLKPKNLIVKKNTQELVPLCSSNFLAPTFSTTIEPTSHIIFSCKLSGCSWHCVP